MPETSDAGNRDAPFLSVVIPAYREGGYLPRALDELAEFAAARQATGSAVAEIVEVLVVDDGSDDDTVAATERAAVAWRAPHRVRLLRHARNRGKGAAVRTGVLGARGKWVVFTDADLAYGTEPINELISELERGADVVAGERRHRSGLLRSAAGFAFAQLARAGGLTTARDPQCGLKGFSAPAAQMLFGLSTIDGFAFDVEILHIAHAYGFDVRTLSVEMRRPEHSSVDLIADGRQMLASLRAIRRATADGLYEVPAPSPRARIRRRL